MAGGSQKAIIAAMGANFGIAVGKFFGFAMTGATSMMAEGVHSLADTANQGLLLWGGVAARREASEVHPFGYGRERYFWSFVVSLVIFTLGGLYAAYEGIMKITHAGEHEISSPAWAIGILSVGILLEGGSFWTAIKLARETKGDASWAHYIRHTKNPELPVVLLEDLGAMAGLMIALVGIILTWVTHNPLWDAVGTTAIGVLLIVIAVILAVEMKSLLIGEGATPEQRRAIREAAENGPNVRKLIHMRTLYLGPDEMLVAMKVEFDHEMNTKELTEAINALESSIREKVSLARIIYIEPDVFAKVM